MKFFINISLAFSETFEQFQGFLKISEGSHLIPILVSFVLNYSVGRVFHALVAFFFVKKVIYFHTKKEIQKVSM